MTKKKTLTDIKNKIIEVGNKISMTDLSKGQKGVKAGLKKQWQIGYLTALNDIMNWIESEE